MSNYVSLHLRVIWQDCHWRLVAVEETDSGSQRTETIVGGIFPVPGDFEDPTDVASALTHIAVDLARSDLAGNPRSGSVSPGTEH